MRTRETFSLIYQADDGLDDSEAEENEGGDTATLSVFGEAMNALSHLQHEKHHNPRK
jgi:hypothetical protein